MNLHDAQRRRKMCKWDKRGMGLARLVSTWSKDPSTKVGAALMDEHHRVLGVGYNGFPRGVEDDWRLRTREVKYSLIVHAEVNAILNSGDPKGATLYCTHFPCNECAKFIVQSGIAEVVAPKEDLEGWKDSQNIAMTMLVEGGIGCRLQT